MTPLLSWAISERSRDEVHDKALYMPRRLAQQWMTMSDLEWPFYASCIATIAINVCLVKIVRYLCGSCVYCL